MKQFTYFAQSANYNCTGAADSSYGAGSYNTCVTAPSSSSNTTTSQVGAPNTGEFFGFVTSGAFSIILPLVIAVVIVTAATIVIARRKHSNQR